MQPFDLQYHRLLDEVLHFGVEETNWRTDCKVRVGNPTSLTFSIADRVLPTCGHRRLRPGTAAAEVAWFLMAERDVTWLRKHCKIWDKFVEADGVTIERAYGYRWRKHFGRDQIRLAIDALHGDRSDRRVYVSAWDPADDGLGAVGQKNVPCPVGFTLSITQGQLNSTMLLRSSDIFVGLPYDVMGHAILMAVLAEELRVRPGVMHVSLAHPHLYDVHYDQAYQALDAYQESTGPAHVSLVQWNLAQVTCAPDDFVAEYRRRAAQATWPNFDPRPEVVA